MTEDENIATDPTQNVLNLVRAESRRQDDMRNAMLDHFSTVLDMMANHSTDLREAEAKRIDAIRQVDVTAVASARSEAEARATALAGQVAAQAESVRVGLAAALEPIQKDIADLRRSQYEGVGGKANVAETQARSGGQGMWIGLAVTVVFALISAVLGVGGLVYAMTK